MDDRDFLKLYDLETYLFNTVRPRFHRDGCLSAFDFFCIVIWKSNRSKSKIAKRLLSNANSNNLEEQVYRLTSGIHQQTSAKDRLRYLFEEWSFWLPTATAILTVLYPEEFTVYDTRVCNELGDFHKLYNLWNFENLWSGYLLFREAVIKSAPDGLSLRDKDRYLWAKSFSRQLEADIANCFTLGNHGD